MNDTVLDKKIDEEFYSKNQKEIFYHYRNSYNDYVLKNLPKEEDLAECINLPNISNPFNIGFELLDRKVNSSLADNIIFIHDYQLNIEQQKTIQFTYKDIYKISNRVCNYLIDHGLKAGDTVVVHGSNSIETTIIWLSLIRAGAIAVMTIDQLQENELLYVVQKSNSNTIIVEKELEYKVVSLMENNNLTSMLKLNMEELIHITSKSYEEYFLPYQTKAEYPCQIFFTSGSTGVPKAVVHLHHDVYVACTNWNNDIYKPDNNDIIYCNAPLGFLFGLIFNTAIPLFHSSKVIIGKKLSPELTLETISRHQVTILITVPTFYSKLIQFKENSSTYYNTSSLKYCICGGEALLPSLEQAWYRLTGKLIYNVLGTTEAGWIFLSSLKPGKAMQAVTGYEVKIVNENDQECGYNENGLLKFKGPTRYKYLLDDRQKTVVKNGWNYTGDIFYKDRDNKFYYVNRADEMIISSGFNINPIEVENALLEHPYVSEVYVTGVSNPETYSILVKASIVLKDSNKETDEIKKELFEYIKTKIAAYKRPKIIEFYKELPKTATGKKQRFKLK